MDAAAIVETITPLVPGALLETVPSVDFPTLYAPCAQIVEVCRALRDTPSLRFDMLVEVTAVDFFPRTPRFEVVYHLVSVANRLRLRVKTRVDLGVAVPTVSGVWAAAGWPEREVWDMFGIVFDGHQDLRRILMPEDWEGHPLRKDYPVQIRKVAQTYQPLEVTEQDFRANLERDRTRRPTTH